jgi:hypothetical protein
MAIANELEWTGDLIAHGSAQTTASYRHLASISDDAQRLSSPAREGWRSQP